MIRGNEVFRSGSGQPYTMVELIAKIEHLEAKASCLTDCIEGLYKKIKELEDE